MKVGTATVQGDTYQVELHWGSIVVTALLVVLGAMITARVVRRLRAG
jgi:hypothetical protein